MSKKGFFSKIKGSFKNKKDRDLQFSADGGKVFIIVGLGNPSLKYEGTRHNVGFFFVDALADKYDIKLSIKKHRSFIGRGVINGHKVILVKPQTYMNLSGEAVRSVCDFFKVDVEKELIIIYDDIALAEGQIRIRERGSAGGHNGIKSIISHIGTQDFIRIRVGVGEKPPLMKLSDYVLGHFSKGEMELLREAYHNSVEAILTILNGEVAKAMSLWNKKTNDTKSS